MLRDCGSLQLLRYYCHGLCLSWEKHIGFHITSMIFIDVHMGFHVTFMWFRWNPQRRARSDQPQLQRGIQATEGLHSVHAARSRFRFTSRWHCRADHEEFLFFYSEKSLDWAFKVECAMLKRVRWRLWFVFFGLVSFETGPSKIASFAVCQALKYDFFPQTCWDIRYFCPIINYHGLNHKPQ